MMSHIRGTDGQAHLSRGKRGPATDGSTTLYTHNSRSQQGKGKNAANPRNGSTIIMPNPVYWPKGLPVAYKIQVPLYGTPLSMERQMRQKYQLY